MMFNILATIGVFAIGIFILLQIFVAAGGKQDQLTRIKWIIPKKTTACTDEKITKKEIGKVAIFAMGFRIGIYLFSALIMRLIWDDGTILNLDSFLNNWRMWEANNYIRIATVGYNGYWENGRATTLVFFPLYSWIMKVPSLW